jgi:hypothetical protein
VRVSADELDGGRGGDNMGYRRYFPLYETTFLSCTYSSFLLFECDIEDLDSNNHMS